MQEVKIQTVISKYLDKFSKQNVNKWSACEVF